LGKYQPNTRGSDRDENGGDDLEGIFVAGKDWKAYIQKGGSGMRQNKKTIRQQGKKRTDACASSGGYRSVTTETGERSYRGSRDGGAIPNLVICQMVRGRTIFLQTN